MPMSEAQNRADAKWHKKAYEIVKLSFRKDSEINGTSIREYAAGRGESLNGFIYRAVKETIEHDNRAD